MTGSSTGYRLHAGNGWIKFEDFMGRNLMMDKNYA